jgi:hypothetical protein
MVNTSMYSDNVLYQLAQSLAGGGHHSTAAALRMLAQAGYTTLDEVDAVSDWVLLSIRGIGVRRLREVRQLTRADWQPPSPQAMQAGIWFLAAAKFALRYWPLDMLVSVIRGSAPAKITEGPVERRLAMDIFAEVERRAQGYYEPRELIQALWQTQGGSPHTVCESSPALYAETEAKENGQSRAMASEPSGMPLEECNETRESDHYAYPWHERLRIVRHYRAARQRGEVQNKERWADSNYSISAKTLLSYEHEFPEDRAKT